jgi:hypothetical protein
MKLLLKLNSLMSLQCSIFGLKPRPKSEYVRVYLCSSLHVEIIRLADPTHKVSYCTFNKVHWI